MIMSEQAIVCCANFEGLDPDEVVHQLGTPSEPRGKKQLETLIDGTIPVAHFDKNEITFISAHKKKTRASKELQLTSHAIQRMKERKIKAADVNTALQSPRGKNGRHVSINGVVVCVATARGGEKLATVYNKV